MSSLVKLDTIVVRLLLLWSLSIVIMPFATQLVADAGDETATQVIYIGTILVSSALLTLIVWRIMRDPSISDAAVPPDPTSAVVMLVLTLLALVAVLAVPAVGYWPLLSLTLRRPVVAGWHRLRA